MELPTNAAHVVTAERAQLLQQLQPNQFYQLDNDDAYFETLMCVYFNPQFCTRLIAQLHHRIRAAGIDQFWLSGLQEMQMLAILQRDANALDCDVERTLAEEYGWIGAVSVIGYAMAAAVFCLEILWSWMLQL